MGTSQSQPVLASNGQTGAKPSAAHTPGPWQVSGGRANHTLYGHGVGPDSAYIALVTYCDRTPEHHVQSLADARLIAAAPELLAAAQELIRCDDCLTGEISMSEYEHAVGMLRAAIAKATQS